MQFDNLFGDGQSQPGADPGRFGRKEWVKNPGRDKLANWGFWSSIVGVSVVLLRLLIDAIGVVVVDGGIIAVLSILAAYAILVGFIICLVAIKRKSITAHGKARAKIGIWIFPFFILIALILTIAAITSYG